MAETRRRHWKVYLTLVLLLGVIGLLLFTDTGRKTLSFLNFNVGHFTKAATPSGAQFDIALTSEIDAYYSQVYKLSNSTFIASGICRQIMKLGDWSREKEETRCNIALPSFAGSFDFTGGSIKLYGEVTDILVDGNLWSSSRPEKIEIEIIPEKFLLKDLSENKIYLPSVTGSIVRGERGSENLSQNSLEIGNFVGYLKLEDNIAILNGTASSVKSEEFSW